LDLCTELAMCRVLLLAKSFVKTIKVMATNHYHEKEY